MIYKLNNHAESILDMDNENVYSYILNKFKLIDSSDSEILEMMKDITRDMKLLHEIAVETRVPIIDILRIIVTEVPDIDDKRFRTRMRKLYNVNNNGDYAERCID